MYLRLPHDEPDGSRRYVLPDPAAVDASVERVRRHAFDEHEPTPSIIDIRRTVAAAEAYLFLASYVLGQEACVRKLRDVWRARRVAARGEE